MSKGGILRALEEGMGSRNGPMKTGNDTLDKLATAVYVAQQAKDWYSRFDEKRRGKTTWTVTLEESDAAYMIVQQWLLETMPETRQKNVTAQTRTVYLDPDTGKMIGTRNQFDEMMDSVPKGSISETRIVLALSVSHNQKIKVGTHGVQVRIQDTQPDDDGTGRPKRRTSSWKSGRIVFTCRSIEAQHAVIEMLNGMVSIRSAKKKPALWVADGWGQWGSQDAPHRKLESVVLADGVKEDIMGDLRKFLADEKRYTELGIPYHRGYLLHGPPGTGKTSLIKALAAELGLDLWYAPLGDLKEDSSLVDLVRSVRSRGVLLLEDVDAYMAALNRDSEATEGKEPGRGISNSALYNALDGVVTPHGLITIMTTNYIEKLDPALTRSGRADRVVMLDLPTWYEIAQLWDMFFPGDKGRVDLLSDQIRDLSPKTTPSQADVSEILKRNWDFPDTAYDELAALCGVKAVRE